MVSAFTTPLIMGVDHMFLSQRLTELLEDKLLDLEAALGKDIHFHMLSDATQSWVHRFLVVYTKKDDLPG